MEGFTIAERGHPVNVLPPIEASGGVVGDRFSMAKHAHASILVQLGVTSVGPTKIIVKECDAASGGNANAIAFDIYKCETASPGANSDVLGPRTAVTSAGYSPPATDNIFYVIELDARHLTQDFPWVELSITAESGQSILASASAVLSGSRYANEQSASVIA